MNWKGLACLFVVILGIILFLYGANYYDYVVGWAGVYLFFIGIVAYVLLRIFWHSTKTKDASDQKP